MIVTPTRNGAGYLFNDDRAAGGKVTEHDIYSCSHCQALIRKAEWKEEGGWCGRCNAPICVVCADKMQANGCEPFMKKIERALEENYRVQQNARVLGL